VEGVEGESCVVGCDVLGVGLDVCYVNVWMWICGYVMCSFMRVHFPRVRSFCSFFVRRIEG